MDQIVLDVSGSWESDYKRDIEKYYKEGMEILEKVNEWRKKNEKN